MSPAKTSAETLPISCYIIAHNEADRIALTINSVRGWVGEIIVVDSGSSDDTVSVCEFLGARVIHNPWPGYGFQKRFAEGECKQHWLLNLDADEEITPPLRDEIMALFASGEPAAAGYIFRIRDLLPQVVILALGAHTDLRIRLYDIRKGRVEASNVHDPVLIAQGETVTLNAPVLHRSFRNLSHMLAKINSYSDVQAENLAKKGLPFARARLLVEFPVAFLKIYFLRLYILRGWRGFIYSMVYAFGRFVRLAKYIERR